MVIFLYGKDTYRSRQKLNEIVERYKKIHKSGLNLKYFDHGEPSPQIGGWAYGAGANHLNFLDFMDEIQQTSIFKEKKLIILTNIFLDTELKKSFLAKENKILTKLAKSDDIILFYEEKEVSEKDSLFVFLNKCAKCQEFKLLGGQELKNWVKKEVGSCKTKIETNALGKLIDFVGSDLWRMDNEIKKLANYKKGKKIEAKDVELLVRPKIEADIFKTIEAIAVKNKKQALGLLHKHLERGDNPLYLLSMINFQFRNLLIIKDLVEKNKPFYTLAKQTRLHPYVIKKSHSQAQKFTIAELKKIYRKIFQADLNIKTGRLNPPTALDLLIAEI